MTDTQVLFLRTLAVCGTITGSIIEKIFYPEECETRVTKWFNWVGDIAAGFVIGAAPAAIAQGRANEMAPYWEDDAFPLLNGTTYKAASSTPPTLGNSALHR